MTQALLRDALSAEDLAATRPPKVPQLDERAAFALSGCAQGRASERFRSFKDGARGAAQALLHMPRAIKKSVRKDPATGRTLFLRLPRNARVADSSIQRSCTCPGTCSIESRDPFESKGFSQRCELALTLLGESAGVTLFLVENAVLGARAGAKARDLEKLAKAGVRMLADEFALRERGITRARPQRHLRRDSTR